MAEGALFNVVVGIINSVVGPLATQEVRLLCGAKDDFEKLAFTVLAIRAMLLDVEKRRPKEIAVRLWHEVLSNVLYEADDLLDAISTEVQQRKIKNQHEKVKRVCKFFSKSSEFAFRLKMAHRIHTIRGKLDSIADNMRFFQFAVLREEPPISNTGRDNDYYFVREEEEVIGREEDKKELINKLLETNIEGNLSILAIVGMVGSGKTTLAQLVYHDKEIQKRFELTYWISAFDPLGEENIYEKFSNSDIGKNINNKKFFLVLDDMRIENREQWFELGRELKKDKKNSKILVTTRNKEVAEKILGAEPYKMKKLKEEELEHIFKRVAFKDKHWPNLEFQEIGRVILKRYAYIPLAVKIIGGMLYFQKTEAEWRSFVEELPVINQDDGNFLPIMELSYNRLPLHLKYCFNYCSMYPKNYEYDKTTIIHEWIAHGFIESENQRLEDIGNNYFMDLIWRSFFQNLPIENDDHVVTRCKMHDLMHDLATSITTRSLIPTFDEKKRKINKQTRQLLVRESFNFQIKELISQCENKMIRTFYCSNFGGEIDCEAIFSSFKFLRVLNLSDNNLQHVSNSINKLKHLRYLDLSRNKEIKVLPHSCVELVNLQFLNLGHCLALKGLPKGIKNLVNLRYLNLDGCRTMTYLPSGLRKSICLQWLKQFRVDLDSPSSHYASLSEFKELNELGGRLIIWNLRHSKDVEKEYEAANIKEKKGLKSLVLHFSSSNEVHDIDVDNESLLQGLEPHANLMKLEMNSYRSVKLPMWILSITGLMELKLYKCRRCQYLPQAKLLRSLKVLDLREMYALDYIFDGGGSEFSSSPSNILPSLFEIHFVKCPKLKGWWRGPSQEIDHDDGHYSEETAVTSIKCHRSLLSFPALKYLHISRCPELDLVGDELAMCWDSLKSLISLRLSGLPKLLSLPWGLQHVGTIQDVSISYCKNLKTVVESILNWKSFKVLRIQECPSLIELPAGIERPTFQLKLIRGNPSLLERYEKDESTDWDEMTDISESSTE